MRKIPRPNLLSASYGSREIQDLSIILLGSQLSLNTQMNKDLNKKSSTDIKRPSRGEIRLDSEDFSTSMARLAELAAKDIITENKDDKNSKMEEEALRQFLTPKRKKEGDDGSDTSPKGIRVVLNPYVITGALVVILSVGFLAIPHIVKLLDEAPTKEDSEQRKLAQLSAKEDEKMRDYSLADAVRDVQQTGELKSMSISELANQVNEINLDPSITKDEQGWFSILSSSNDIQLSGEGGDEILQNQATSDSALENSNSEIERNASDVSPNGAVGGIFDAISTEISVPLSFQSVSGCYSGGEILADESNTLFFEDVMGAIWLNSRMRVGVGCK